MEGTHYVSHKGMLKNHKWYRKLVDQDVEKLMKEYTPARTFALPEESSFHGTAIC